MAQLPDAESVYFDTISQMRVDRWSRGLVVLLGDAAWCVTLFAGYGSSLAVGGAYLLGAELERHQSTRPCGNGSRGCGPKSSASRSSAAG